MRDVSIIGIGQTPVAESWEQPLREIASQAAQIALHDSGLKGIDALFVANMLAGELSRQEHLGALLAGTMGMAGIEAVRVEAADASGGAALRQAYLSIASGAIDTAMVLGVEKVTDIVGSARLSAMATSLDAEFEAEQGATPAALAALLMQRYMHEYNVPLEAFAGFSENAHFNGSLNPYAMYRNKLRPGMFAAAPAVATPVGLFDAAPDGDGAAAVVLAATDLARDLVPQPVRILASAAASDTLALHQRKDMLHLAAVTRSAQKALMQAGITNNDVDVLELHDSFTILTALALEALGYAGRGEGHTLARPEIIGLQGSRPLSTFGGLKARGHAGGATGVYQTVEIVLQLRGAAGANQVPGARIGLAQSVGGLGGTAITHILVPVE